MTLRPESQPVGVPSKRLRRLGTRSQREARREFLAEGPQAVAEAIRRPGTVIEVFATREAHDRHLAGDQGDAPVTIVDEPSIVALSDTVTPQGIVAHCRFVDEPVDVILAARPRLIAICADVRDPGNAGTVVRCADAAGADAVLFGAHSVDPYNPKAVRASAGSLFHLGIGIDDDLPRMLATLRGHGVRVLAADGAGPTDLFDAAADGLLDAPVAWLFGNEAWGLPERTRRLADASVAVPIYGRAESLNLATAAAVCLYSAARAQRIR